MYDDSYTTIMITVTALWSLLVFLPNFASTLVINTTSTLIFLSTPLFLKKLKLAYFIAPSLLNPLLLDGFTGNGLGYGFSSHQSRSSSHCFI
jgi:hypothetical protein